MGCSRAEKVITTYGFLGDDGEVAGVDALVAELPRRVPRRDAAAEDDVLEVPGLRRHVNT